MKWMVLLVILSVFKYKGNEKRVYFEGEGPGYEKFKKIWISLSCSEKMKKLKEFERRVQDVFEYFPPTGKSEEIIKGKKIKYFSRSDYVKDLFERLKKNPENVLLAYKLEINLAELEAAALKKNPVVLKEPLQVFVSSVPPYSRLNVEGGVGWSSDVLVAYSTLPEQVPSITIDSSGNLYIALVRGPKSDTTWLDIYYSTNGAVSWNWYAGLYETSSQWDFADPSLACDIGYNNRLIVAYTADFTISGLDADIYVGLYDPGVGWITTADTIDNDSENDLSPWVTAEYQYGTANYYYVVYHEPEGIISRYGDDMSIHLRTSTDHGRTWDIHTSFGEALTDISVRAQPYITNSEGVVYASYSYGDDWANRNKIVVAKSTDFGNTWTETIVYDEGSTANYPCYQASIASSHGGGSVLVVFQREYSASDHDVLSSYSYDQGATWTFQYAPAYTTADERIPYAIFMGWGYPGNDVYGNVLVAYYKDGYAVVTISDYNNLSTFYLPEGTAENASDSNTVLFSNWGQINAIWWKDPPGPGSARIVVSWTDTTYGLDYDVRAAYTLSSLGEKEEFIIAKQTEKGILLLFRTYKSINEWEIEKKENGRLVKKIRVKENSFLDKEVKPNTLYSYKVKGYSGNNIVCFLGPVEIFYKGYTFFIPTFISAIDLKNKNVSIYTPTGRKVKRLRRGEYFVKFKNDLKIKVIILK